MASALLARVPLVAGRTDDRTAARERLLRLLGLGGVPAHQATTAAAAHDAVTQDAVTQDAGSSADAQDAVTQDTTELVPAVESSRPSGRHSARVRLGLEMHAAAGLVLVCVVAVALGALYLWRSQPVPVSPPKARVVATPAVSPTPSSSSVVVDVAGKVRDPGVVTLPAGSRVVDALRRAGGARTGADTSALNLARVLVDGEQVLVGAPAAAAAGAVPVPTSAVGTTPTALLDLNTVTVEQLDTLPGIGPVLAQRIVEHRTSLGRFSAVEELQEVSGIGEKRFADLQGKVRV